MNIAIIDVGSNIDSDNSIAQGKNLIAQEHTLLSASLIIRTEAIGDIPQPEYLNCAFKIGTIYEQEELNLFLKQVESKLGRIHTRDKFAPRTIDLDIIAWNGKVIHNDFYERDFVKKYTLEIEPNLTY